MFDSPEDEALRVASAVDLVRPTHLLGWNQAINVPQRYSVWAIPPAPNKVVELLTSEEEEDVATFPTFVGKRHLLPGEGYQDARPGHGSWTFYVPLDDKLLKEARAVDGSQFLQLDASNEKHLIFVGIALFERGRAGYGRLLGFAPAPFDDALLDPEDF